MVNNIRKFGDLNRCSTYVSACGVPQNIWEKDVI